MTKFLAILAATTCCAGLSVSALAQDYVDNRYAQIRDGGVAIDDSAVTVLEEDGIVANTYVESGEPVLIRRTIERRPTGDVVTEYYGRVDGDLPQQGQARYFGYSMAERDQWLSQCRALRSDDDGYVVEERRNRRNASTIGAVTGAVAGGVIGNRVADGNRLAGTVIGAGAGGIAGAAIGSAIDGSREERVAASDTRTLDYCEAYLINYERGYGVPQG